MINEIAQKQIDYIAQRCKEIKPLVAIRCITYNHEPYLKDALEGFIMQKTDFPFVAIVHDDASTDKTAEVLKEYAERYPDIIFPIYEQENQYSTGTGIITKIMDSATNATGAEYIALCEGDDYWIDRNKLQKQVSFLQSNPEYSICTTNTYELKNNILQNSKWNNLNNQELKIEDVILNGGNYIATGTICFPIKYYKNKPNEMNNLYVGDYPLQIYLSHIGKAIKLKEITNVYRKLVQGSWSLNQKNLRFDYNKKQKEIKKELTLLNTMNKVTNNKYNKIFNLKINRLFFISYIPFSAKYTLKAFIKHPFDIMKNYGLKLIIFSFLPVIIKRLYYKNKY